VNSKRPSWRSAFATTVSVEGIGAIEQDLISTAPLIMRWKPRACSSPHWRILWNGVLANFQPGPQDIHVDYHNDNRSPLLFISGSEDHIMPPKVQRSNARHYRSNTTTEVKEYEGMGHLLPAQPGWEEVADHALAWAVDNAGWAPVTSDA
jgi:pimeloyl-ACP methyl ester carboxylesterase